MQRRFAATKSERRRSTCALSELAEMVARGEPKNRVAARACLGAEALAKTARFLPGARVSSAEAAVSPSPPASPASSLDPERAATPAHRGHRALGYWPGPSPAANPPGESAREIFTRGSRDV